MDMKLRWILLIVTILTHLNQNQDLAQQNIYIYVQQDLYLCRWQEEHCSQNKN